jgi:hypothetical protein
MLPNGLKRIHIASSVYVPFAHRVGETSVLGLFHVFGEGAPEEQVKGQCTKLLKLNQEPIERLADLPTPAGPTPRELESQRQDVAKLIPLQSVQRSKKARPRLSC